MIARSEGFEIGNFRIPPFELREGELISICLFSGEHFFDLEMKLANLFAGITTHSKLTINQNMEFVEHIKTNGFKNSIFPLTVGKYLSKNGQAKTEELKRTFGLDYISSKTKVNTLAGNPRKWLSIISSFSKSDKIVFDMVGQDPRGAQKTMEIVGEFVKKGGTAILIDNFDEKYTDITRYYQVEKK